VEKDKNPENMEEFGGSDILLIAAAEN